MLKKNKGITLVALIITIVVLLIIAVVAIGAVRDSSIIGHAQNAAKDYNSAKDAEESTLSDFEDIIAQYANGGGTENGGGSSGSTSVDIDTLKKYILGPELTGRPMTDIIDMDEFAFKDDTSTK